MNVSCLYVNIVVKPILLLLMPWVPFYLLIRRRTIDSTYLISQLFIPWVILIMMALTRAVMWMNWWNDFTITFVMFMIMMVMIVATFMFFLLCFVMLVVPVLMVALFVSMLFLFIMIMLLLRCMLMVAMRTRPMFMLVLLFYLLKWCLFVVGVWTIVMSSCMLVAVQNIHYVQITQ